MVDRSVPREPLVPYLGIGVGLRPVHYPEILDSTSTVTRGIDWFEAISENYMVEGGRPLRALDAVRSRFPIALHGVSLDIGTTDPLDARYLDALDALARRFEPAWLSDHLCWTGVDGECLHDLLPLPATEPVLRFVAERVMRVQDRLGRRVALENVSSYVAFQAEDMTEWEFLAELAVRADCGILLDVNNVFVSAHNHGFDAGVYVDSIPGERIFQLHLAGPSESGPLLIDTHDSAILDPVWQLYERVLRRVGPVSTLIEWDDAIPPLEHLVGEADRARAILEQVAHDGGFLA